MPPEPVILAFDTSAAHCAAALLSGDRILAARTEEMAKGQAERLFPLLAEILAEAGAGWGDLTAIGVGIGPGNFTGVRLSVAAARGLALARTIPAIGVSTLRAQAFGTAGVVVSSLDARRDSLYVQVFGAEEGFPATICDIHTLPPIPAGAEPICIGHRAGEIAARCAGRAEAAKLPVAVAIARVAAATRFSVRDRPAPLYLRPADAAPSRDTPPVILP